jgi:hypothetical protein
VVVELGTPSCWYEHRTNQNPTAPTAPSSTNRPAIAAARPPHHSSPLRLAATARSHASAPSLLGPSSALPADRGTTSWKPTATTSGPPLLPPPPPLLLPPVWWGSHDGWG